MGVWGGGLCGGVGVFVGGGVGGGGVCFVGGGGGGGGGLGKVPSKAEVSVIVVVL